LKRFSNILLIADKNLNDSTALNRAISLASNNNAALTLIDIVDVIPPEIQMAITTKTPMVLCEILATEKQEQLTEVARTAARNGVDIEVMVLIGKRYLEVIRQVLRNKHDLVIKCAEPLDGLKQTLFGSTDMHLMRKCPCPVWIIKSSDHKHNRRILAAVDRDPEDTQKDALNRPILEMATSLALTEAAELHVIHAWEAYSEDLLRSPRMPYTDAEVDLMVEEEEASHRQWLKKLLVEHAEPAATNANDCAIPKLHLVKGRAQQIIPLKARDLDVDLIIMGTVARTGIPGFFIGNTAESILNQIDCSVLTIKPPGFVSPVSL